MITAMLVTVCVQYFIVDGGSVCLQNPGYSGWCSYYVEVSPRETEPCDQTTDGIYQERRKWTVTGMFWGFPCLVEWCLTLGIYLYLFPALRDVCSLFTASSVPLAAATAGLMLQRYVSPCVFLELGCRSLGPPDGSLCRESTVPQFQDHI